ncbi:MAG: HNH endonuclease [Saprospiraceae bacterium]|nr:HNH endonuclease [Saprospiraceae bacterium]
MANRWGIPKEVEDLVKKRDLYCVYCGVLFTNSVINHKTRPTWEHIVNDIRINGIENIALCCGSCNASKGTKLLSVWLTSNYCTTKGITKDNVATVVKEFLNRQ